MLVQKGIISNNMLGDAFTETADTNCANLKIQKEKRRSAKIQPRKIGKGDEYIVALACHASIEGNTKPAHKVGYLLPCTACFLQS
jgi:hypothetical protein